jgi:hypothetical protein
MTQQNPIRQLLHPAAHTEDTQDGYWPWIDEAQTVDAEATQGMSDAERAAYYRARGAEARAARAQEMVADQADESRAV